jgi:hypothetical protein
MKWGKIRLLAVAAVVCCMAFALWPAGAVAKSASENEADIQLIGSHAVLADGTDQFTLTVRNNGPDSLVYTPEDTQDVETGEVQLVVRISYESATPPGDGVTISPECTREPVGPTGYDLRCPWMGMNVGEEKTWVVNIPPASEVETLFAGANEGISGIDPELNNGSYRYDFPSASHSDELSPCAGNDSYAVSPGKTLSVPASLGLLTNDFDPEGEKLHVRLEQISFGHNKLKLNTSTGDFTFKAGQRVGYAEMKYRAVAPDGRRSTVARVRVGIGAKKPKAVAPSCFKGDRDLEGLGDLGKFIGAKRFEKNEIKVFKEPEGGKVRLDLSVTFTATRWANHVEVKGAASVRSTPSVRYLCLLAYWSVYTKRGVSSLRPISDWENPEAGPYEVDYVGREDKPTWPTTEVWPFRGPYVERQNASYAGFGLSGSRGVLSWESAERAVTNLKLNVTAQAGSQGGCRGRSYRVTYKG